MNRDFQRIAESIAFIKQHANEQPSLATIAKHINVSPHHFHRIFSRYCGVTPKQFLQVLTVEHAKNILNQQKTTMDAALGAGLSGGNRLHDHFVTIEAVSPGEFKSKGEKLLFSYGCADSPFGMTTIVWTDRGIHRLEFSKEDDSAALIAEVNGTWPKADFKKDNSKAQSTIDSIFKANTPRKEINLWLSGSNFQINVWRALLAIESGELRAYGELAHAVGKPKAARAIGTAIGKNPVAYLIPCHRVIQRSGALGGYRWDTNRKHVMLACEFFARQQKETPGLQEGSSKR